jgi:hypothetical protein
MSTLAKRKEIYFSGVVSPSIRKGRLYPRCLGVYVTNKRMLVVHAPVWMQIMYHPSLLIAVILEVSAVAIVFYSIVFSILSSTPSQLSSGVQTPVALAFLVLEWAGLAFLIEGLLTG